jgi:hypothetical protein
VKRLVVGGAVLALGLAGSGLASAGTDAGQGAQKTALSAVVPQDNHVCDSSETAKEVTGTNGFVILNAPGKVGAVKKIVGEVSLKRGVPGMYTVYLAQAGSAEGDDGVCELTGTLTANDQGNGNSHIDTNKVDIDVPGTGGEYYVVLRNMTSKEIYASAPVNVI